MSKNKNQNQHGSFVVRVSGMKNYKGYFVTILLVVIFVLGISTVIYKKMHKPVIAGQNTETPILDLSKIPGWWYDQYFRTSSCDRETCKPDADPDDDKLTNLQEYYYHTNPLDAYTVKDKSNDGQLVAGGFDPSRPGHMKFDQVISPDNILGESLLLDKDLKDIVDQANDISKVNLSLVAASEIQTTRNTDNNTYQTYLANLQETINKYFSQSDISNIGEILKSTSDSNLDEVNTKANLLAEELKTIRVPETMLTYHRYIITFFQLIPKVLLKNNNAAFNSSSSESDQWYENAQALLAVVQKLNQEAQRLHIQQIP